jgi:hypothetical protein
MKILVEFETMHMSSTARGLILTTVECVKNPQYDPRDFI